MYLDIDRTSKNPLRNQLYEQLLARILRGELAPGTQMPSSRYLHNKLNISRNLILEVYEQLSAEGYLEGRHGKGTWVSYNGVRVDPAIPRTELTAAKNKKMRESKDCVNFVCGLPDLRKFPVKKWRRSVDYAWSLADTELYSYPPVRGTQELRIEISEYLLRAKGIHTSPECIVITSGTTESLLLVAMHFAAESKEVLIEDPVIDFAPSIFSSYGYTLHRVPVDEEGLNVSQLPAHTDSRLIFVSPSHQYPLGVELSVNRRIALVEYARAHNMYIFEDDYDSEFRYEGQPLKSLFLIDRQRVIHAGTFSKNMLPSLRLAYLVVPESAVDAVIATKHKLNMRSPIEVQLAMAHFMRSGAFGRHLAATKGLYRQKFELLRDALKNEFGDSVVINPNAAGLHLHLTFREMNFDCDDCEALLCYGVDVDSESSYSYAKKRGGLLLGFGNTELSRIGEGVARLKRGIEELVRSRGV